MTMSVNEIYLDKAINSWQRTNMLETIKYVLV